MNAAASTAGRPFPFGDAYLAPFRAELAERARRIAAMRTRLLAGSDPNALAAGHEFYGLHRTSDGWVFREWAPNANAIFLIGDFCAWQPCDAYRLTRISNAGQWELRLAADAIRPGAHYRLLLQWPHGSGERIPAYARRVVQDEQSKIFSAQVWAPPTPYAWQHKSPPRPATCLIYESHVGMAQEAARVGTYDEFRTAILPRIVQAGYNTIQLMAILEHPYYGSFGYHVSNFFAASSRFGTPHELKALIDTAHGMGLRIVIDLVHSHAVKNEAEGLACFDGTPYQYFHAGGRGEHTAWDSRCFDYGKPEVLHFLLSNCRFWLDEYHVDGFRFDGITSMLYHDRGLGKAFLTYADYFNANVDLEALVYLALANELIHSVRPDAITIAEDVSGMPGLAGPPAEGGCGFDYRLAMGIPDYWFKLVEDVRDEDWSMHGIWHALTDKRAEEHTISYVECHDQAIVGSKTLIFHLAGAEMYTHMRIDDPSAPLDRAIALHKLIRLATAATADAGYLAFMGNEFGHPEWIDFPREGNGWSYHYARRQWRLRDDPGLKYRFLAEFDNALMQLVTDLAGGGHARLVFISANEHIIAFERGGIFVILNFHPDRSFTDYPLETLPGRYSLVMDTDEQRFGGPGRLAPKQVYSTQPLVRDNVLQHRLRLYLPSRCALILRHER
jgi:1,4-alpha-glucan branching enzyme